MEELKTRWRTLRERFVKEMKYHESCTGNNGESQEDESTKWKWYDSMLFLIDHIRTRKTRDSKTVAQRIVPDMDVALSQFKGKSEDTGTESASSSTTATPTPKRKKYQQDGSIPLEMLRRLKAIERPQQSDEDDIFCKAVACELRKITDQREKQRRKAKIYLIATGLSDV